ncbi:MAG: replication factor C large subunit [Candidatus Woesearchaeota archaeon]
MAADTWTKKYAPKKGAEVVGQDKAITALKTFVVNFKNAKRRGLILYGPPGCGKTSSVYAIANELAKEIIEVNASDCRNKDAIDAVVGSASKQTSLFFRGKIILVDELDGVSGMNDRGGVAAIADIVKTTSFPIVITANNPFDEKFSSLRKVCDSTEFVEMDCNNAFAILRKIADAEKLKCEDADLKSLARRSGGDLRGAITDLQILTTVGGVFDKNALDDLEGRKQTESMPTALTKVLKTTDPKIALTAFENVNEDVDEQMMWVDYNLGMEYTKAEDLYRAYTSLAKADIFSHRIRRWMHWRYLVYVGALMTAGVAVAKDEKYKFVGYKPTSRILKIWGANMRNAKKKAIAEKIAEHTHTSKKVVIRDVMPYLQVAFKNDANMCKSVSEELDLSSEEVDWLKK